VPTDRQRGFRERFDYIVQWYPRSGLLELFLFSDSILKQDYCAAPSQTVSISVPQIFSFHRHLFTLDTSFSPPSLIKQKQGSNFQEKVLNS